MDSRYNIIADEAAAALAGRLGAGYGEEALTAAANKGTYKRAVKELSGGAEISLAADGDRLMAEILGERVTLREKISECKCSCSAKVICRHIVAAAIAAGEFADPEAAKAAENSHESEADNGADTAEKHAKSDDGEVDGEYLLSVKKAAENILAKGLAVCTAEDVTMLQQLAVKGAKYPALANGCRSVAENITQMNARSAAFLPLNAAHTVCRLYNTAAAAEGGAVEILKRGSYVEQGSGELICLGAYPWVSRAGYLGVTAAFYMPQKKQCFTYTATLPTFYREKTAERRSISSLFSSPDNWENEVSISSLVGRRIFFTSLKADERQRISSSKSISCIVGRRVTPDSLPRELFEIPDSLQISGDYFSQGAERFFALPSPTIEAAYFSSTAQGLVYKIGGEGAVLGELFLGYEQASIKAIKWLEKNAGRGFDGGCMIMRRSRRQILPLCLYTDTGDVENIYF